MSEYDATRQAFAGLIEKPALTDQLLSRPPFKFLLDVITNTITSTGYLKSQFPKSDLDPAALTDKVAKTAFLDKFIGAVDDGSLSAVKSAKIVAGKEPELTNKLLLKLAENARNFMGGGQAEKKSKDKSTKEKSSKDKEKEKKDKDRSKSKDRGKDKEKEKPSQSSSKDKEKRSSSKSRDKEKPKDKDEKKEKKSKKSSVDKEKAHKKKKEKESVPETSTHLVDVNENLLDRDLDEGFEEVHQLSPHQLPEKMSPGNDSGILELDEQQPLVQRSAVPEFQRPSTAAARPQTSMGRPGTAAARPAPPKIKKKVIATIEEAPAPAESTVQIMAEEAAGEDDKNDLFVEEVIEDENHFIPDAVAAPIEAEEGGLVQKMMETKAGLEEGQLLDDIDEDDTEFQHEMNKMNELQRTLQGITRTICPLAHIFEYAQEDLEAMIRELEKWRAEVRQNEAELKEKESMSMGEAQKLTRTLSNLDEEIRNIKVNLSNCRARIVSNEERIQLLMKDV